MEKKHLDRYHTHIRRGFSKISPEVSLQRYVLLLFSCLKRGKSIFLVFYVYSNQNLWIFQFVLKASADECQSIHMVLRHWIDTGTFDRQLVVAARVSTDSYIDQHSIVYLQKFVCFGFVLFFQLYWSKSLSK